MSKDNMAVLIIAAGYSSRMHDFKPLLPLGKTKALKRLIQTYQKHGIKHIYVVTGHNQEEILKELKDDDVAIVYNEKYDNGMFSSIQKGLSMMSEAIEAFYMQPVDIPLVKVESLERLYNAYKSGHKGLIYPIFLGRKGHPPLIDIKYKNSILVSDGEGGLKQVLEAFKDDALHVSVCDQSVMMDMDTFEDYGALVAYEALGVPNEKECLAILEQNEVDEHIIKHTQAVGKIVLRLLDKISKCNLNFDKNELLAAALLHDISRKEKNHAFVGAQKLRLMGYKKVGDIIETHMDIDVDMNQPLNENELLFLADKLVSEDEVCGFEERFEKARIKCKDNLEALENINKRVQATRNIIRKIENLTRKVFSYG
ncbi:DVU_1551 family NTP transferase [Sulfurospirillum arcachonense]|uniref:DVU_1551 family NTP transferase n=1 Tax=Sulfurospirillum arcachonense TaxID=57666 RepID=UPI00046ABCC9|nr:NTP transferase domain-containing protein [Sulfurospirillum arcachonense]